MQILICFFLCSSITISYVNKSDAVEPSMIYQVYTGELGVNDYIYSIVFSSALL